MTTTTTDIPKLVRNGRVAVLYSPGFGAGWYTWSDGDLRLLFDPEIAEAVEAGDKKKAYEIAERKYPDKYLGGLDGLRIEWIDQGTLFRVDEYDGSENVEEIYSDAIVA